MITIRKEIDAKINNNTLPWNMNLMNNNKSEKLLLI